jgi:hypothetical protein
MEVKDSGFDLSSNFEESFQLIVVVAGFVLFR